jgi:hypothetical protein
MSVKSSAVLLTSIFTAACGGAAAPPALPRVQTTVVQKAPVKQVQEKPFAEMKVFCKGDAERFTRADVDVTFGPELSVAFAGGREMQTDRCTVLGQEGQKTLPVTVTCLAPKAKKPFEIAHSGLMALSGQELRTVDAQGNHVAVPMTPGTRCVLTLGKKVTGLEAI